MKCNKRMSQLNHKRYIRQNWSELNEELLEIIVSKLPWRDVARFRSVCSSWAVVPKPGPLLLLPLVQDDDDDDDPVQLGLHSVRDKVTWDLNWNVQKSDNDPNPSEPEEFRVVGSSHGWMIMMDKSANPYLYNLSSKIRIELPGKDAIQGLVDGISYFEPSDFRDLIMKAILTGNPSHTQDYKVVIIHNVSQKLAFWCKGNDTWKGFSDCQEYLDIVWSDSDETLYALRTSGGVAIEGWKISGDVSTRKVFIQCPFSYADDPLNHVARCGREWTAHEYLVQSRGGGLLFVSRFRGEYVDEDGKLLDESDLLGDETLCYRTVKFRVYKVDGVRQDLEEVKCLQDEVLFLGGNHSVSLPAVECQGFKANSICFTDDYWLMINQSRYGGGHDCGMFCLEDGRVDSVFESHFVRRRVPFPFWILTT